MRVYFIQVEIVHLIKVGVASNLQKRILAIRVGCPLRLQLLAHMPGDEDIERALHRKLATHRVQGEWFEPHADVMAEVEKAREHPQHVPLAPVERHLTRARAAAYVMTRCELDDDSAFEMLRNRRDIANAIDYGRRGEADRLIDAAFKAFVAPRATPPGTISLEEFNRKLASTTPHGPHRAKNRRAVAADDGPLHARPKSA